MATDNDEGYLPESDDEVVDAETAEVKEGDKPVTSEDSEAAPAEEGETFYAGINEDNAVLLLAAAEEAGLDQRVVTVNYDRGGFNAPAEVVAKVKSANKDEEEARVEQLFPTGPWAGDAGYGPRRLRASQGGRVRIGHH